MVIFGADIFENIRFLGTWEDLLTIEIEFDWYQFQEAIRSSYENGLAGADRIL